MIAYVGWLKQYSMKLQVDLHAWVLMTNHVHLLCTPQQENAVSRMMQSVGRMYVRYFNQRHERSGTLWEGRFKASLIESEQYLLEVYRYIELNPVRANMVDSPSQYRWSSHRYNGLGIESDLCTPHKLYQNLGANPSERRQNYRALFNREVSPELIENLRKCTNSGLAMGGKSFVESVEAIAGVRVSRMKMGRPKKCQV